MQGHMLQNYGLCTCNHGNKKALGCFKEKTWLLFNDIKVLYKWILLAVCERKTKPYIGLSSLFFLKDFKTEKSSRNGPLDTDKYH